MKEPKFLVEDYLPADKYVVLNDNDPDLVPIVLKLPKPPSYSRIDGFGLPHEEQRFKRVEYPRRLLLLEEEALNSLLEEYKSDKVRVVTNYKIQKRFWELLEQRKNQFNTEIRFIKRMWWHRMNGYWFFNRGKPTYITGWHFTYLNFWKMDTDKGIAQPDYRDRDRKEFLFKQYAYTTDETFAKVDDNGYAVPELNGKYKMKRIKRRLCYGTIQPKNRRSGNTNKAMAIGIEIVTRTIGTDGFGFMSYNGDHSEEQFRTKLHPSYNNLPIIFQPMTTTSKSSNEIKFDIAKTDYNGEGLYTKVTYATTMSPSFYDGKKLIYALMDEEGKCFGRGIKIRMYDGGYKLSEDIEIGDVLMGDDSSPRRVLSLFRGRSKMYNVIPNKGTPWTCNGKHLLTVENCLSIPYHGIPPKGTASLPVEEYLTFSNALKKSLMLKKTGVDYKRKEHSIDPYFLGLWLGDGSHGGGSIANVDREVIDYLHEYGAEKNIRVVKDNHVSHHLYKTNGEYGVTVTLGGIVKKYDSAYDAAVHFGIKTDTVRRLSKFNLVYNGYRFGRWNDFNLTTELGKINVKFNKHIPDDYLFDCEENRLLLLAGIIDSDGYRFPGNKIGYEVTQKRGELSGQIRRLALDLGFDASIHPKIAKMKRDDGSYYECEVFRVNIYGKDLYRIPCRVERKQYHKTPLHINTRNPMRSGFRIEPIGDGDYYGFEVDGNNQFLLEDNTIVHNCQEDMLKRWDIIKNCLSQGNGVLIHGYSEHPSTVDEMTSGSASYRHLCETSKFYRRIQSSGQTYSGLFRLFVPASEGLDGFIDSYGFSVRGELLDYQKEEGFVQTADQYLMGERDALLKDGSVTAMAKYRELRKLFPLQYSDSFLGESGDIGFDMEVIDRRMADLRRVNDVRRGNLEWKNKVYGGEVYWIDDEVNGKWLISQFPPENTSNKKVIASYYSTFDGSYVPMYKPANPGFFTIGADPFRFSNKQEANMKLQKTGSSSRLSDGGISVLFNYQDSIDKGKKIDDWESYIFVMSYRYRVRNTEEYNEDVLKTAIFWGGMVYPETNEPTTYEYFIRNKFGGYLLYDVDILTGKLKEKPGVHNLEGSKMTLFNLLRDYIAGRGHKENFYPFLQECKDIRGMEEMRSYDRLAAHGLALMGAKSQYADLMKGGEETYDFDDYVETY